jgi:hypothetical protein
LKLGEIYNAKTGIIRLRVNITSSLLTFDTRGKNFNKTHTSNGDMTDFKWFSADPDLVKDYFDLGVIYEYEFNDFGKAASLYLALLRHAPFYRESV